MDWQPMSSAPRDGTRVVVWFKSGGPVVAFKDSPDAETWVRHLGFGKSAYWPEIHDDYAQAWLPLPPPPQEQGGMK